MGFEYEWIDTMGCMKCEVRYKGQMIRVDFAELLRQIKILKGLEFGKGLSDEEDAIADFLKNFVEYEEEEQ